MEIKVNNANEPVWGEMSIKTKLPPNLEPLNDLAQNVYWSWNHDVRELFKSIDPTVWSQYRHNPKVTLDIVEEERFDELANDKSFCDNLDKVYRRYLEYKNTPFRTDTPSIAYFSMEYGLTDHLKIYSGGLGVLAGDYLKEASDSRVNMVAVGFLYRYGYFTQSLSVDGQQIADYEAQNFSKLAITQVKDEHGNAVVISVPFPNRMVYSNIWRVDVGRIPLYLLDTDIDINSEEDRTISHQLYGGDNENRLKQEIVLGVGGILALQRLGIKQDVYHCNEGHAALINLQRLTQYLRGIGGGAVVVDLYRTYACTGRTRLFRRRAIQSLYARISFASGHHLERPCKYGQKQSRHTRQILYERICVQYLSVCKWCKLFTRRSIEAYVCPSVEGVFPRRKSRRVRYKRCPPAYLDYIGMEDTVRKYLYDRVLQRPVES